MIYLHLTVTSSCYCLDMSLLPFNVHSNESEKCCVMISVAESPGRVPAVRPFGCICEQHLSSSCFSAVRHIYFCVLSVLTVGCCWHRWSDQSAWDADQFSPYSRRPIRNVKQILLSHLQCVLVEQSVTRDPYQRKPSRCQRVYL